MGKKTTLRPMGLKDLNKILSVALVIGEGAAECFRTGGVGELYQGSKESPARFRIKIMDFLHEDTLQNVLENIRRRYAVSAPLVDVLVLRGEDERSLEGLLAKEKRVAETFSLNKEGELMITRPGKPCIPNAPEKEIETMAQSSEMKMEVVYHDVTDILMKVSGRDDVFVHEIKGEEGQYVLDFKQMKYWKIGGLEPDMDDRLPAYSSFRDISFGACQYLLIAQESRADVLINCSMRWTDNKLVLEVSRPFKIGGDKLTTMYNFFLPAGRYLSSFWFNGVDTSGKSKILDNRAYLKTLRGRQWYHIFYSGKVEKEKFEPDGF